MKISSLPHWPPDRFQAAKKREPVHPADPMRLVIRSATFVPGLTGDLRGEVVLILRNKDDGEECSTRIRVSDRILARRVEQTFRSCEGLTLADAGEAQIHGGSPP